MKPLSASRTDLIQIKNETSPGPNGLEPLLLPLSRFLVEGKNGIQISCPEKRQKGEKAMKPSQGQFTGNRRKNANLLRAGATLITIFLVSMSAWAGDHQICYQIPPVNGVPAIAA